MSTGRNALGTGGTCLLGLAMLDLGLEQFMIVPLIPAVQQAEQTSLTTAAWLGTGFSLAMVATAPILGRLGDMYGKRRLLLVALAAFALGSLVCALSDSIEGLIAGRVIQGSGAATAGLATGLARDLLPRERVPVVVGFLVAAAAAGGAVGLVLTGLLVDHVSVDAVFWFLFAFAVVLAPLVWAAVPETRLRDRVRPDWIGGALLSSGVLAALLGISQGNQWGWSSARVLGLFVLAGVLLAVFVLVERIVRDPLVDIRAMTRRPLWGASVAAFSVSFAFFIFLLLVPQIATLPHVSGYGLELTITETGLLVLPGALASIAGGWLSGRLVATTGARLLVAAGSACAAAAYVSLALWHGGVGAIAVAVAALGLGIGLAVAAIVNLVVDAAGERRTSVSVAVNFVVRTIGAALGIQVAAAVLTGADRVGPFPAESGFTNGFVLGAVAAAVAVAATIAVPRRSADPLVDPARADPFRREDLVAERST